MHIAIVCMNIRQNLCGWVEIAFSSLHTSEGDLEPWLVNYMYVDTSYNGEVGPQHIDYNRYSYTHGNN